MRDAHKCINRILLSVCLFGNNVCLDKSQNTKTNSLFTKCVQGGDKHSQKMSLKHECTRRLTCVVYGVNKLSCFHRAVCFVGNSLTQHTVTIASRPTRGQRLSVLLYVARSARRPQTYRYRILPSEQEPLFYSHRK